VKAVEGVAALGDPAAILLLPAVRAKSEVKQTMKPTRRIEMNTLAEKSMLVRLTRSMYQPYAYDDEATKEVEKSHGVSRAGRFNKRLLKDSTRFAKVNQAFNAVYLLHMSRTLPWLDDGLRILPAQNYLEYANEMRPVITIATRLADELAAHWGEEIDEDRKRLNGLFNVMDYPVSVREKYSIRLQFLPVPTASDFRVEISEEDKASLDDAVRDAEQGVKTHILKSLMEPLERAVKKLSIPVGAEGAVFRDSMLENILETAERMQSLDLTGDAGVAKLLGEVKALGEQGVRRADSIRHVPGARDLAREEMERILNNMKGVM